MDVRVANTPEINQLLIAQGYICSGDAVDATTFDLLEVFPETKRYLRGSKYGRNLFTIEDFYAFMMLVDLPGAAWDFIKLYACNPRIR